MTRDDLLYELGYLLNSLAQDCTAEARGELSTLCERLTPLVDAARVGPLVTQVHRSLVEARACLVSLPMRRVDAAVRIWKSFDLVHRAWPALPA